MKDASGLHMSLHEYHGAGLAYLHYLHQKLHIPIAIGISIPVASSLHSCGNRRIRNGAAGDIQLLAEI